MSADNKQIFFEELNVHVMEQEIYNNIGTYGDYSGRLSIKHRIYPSPAVLWDFEILENHPPELRLMNDGRMGIHVEKIAGIGVNLESFSHFPDRTLFGAFNNFSGFATRCTTGNLDAKFQSIRLKFCNVNFIHRAESIFSVSYSYTRDKAGI